MLRPIPEGGGGPGLSLVGAPGTAGVGRRGGGGPMPGGRPRLWGSPSPEALEAGDQEQQETKDTLEWC